MSIITGILEQGMIYAIMALGIYITYKILDFPDLTVDGSFPLGGAVTATLMVNGVNPYLTLPAAFLAGAAAGTITGIIHVKFKVRDLLSGIIMMTALYTVNLKIAGKANVPLFSVENIFDNGALSGIVPETVSPYQTVIIVLLILLAVKLLLDGYLKTKAGLRLRAVGDNPVLVTSLAKDSGKVKILGLAIANGLVALAGGVLAQWQRVFDITVGTGTMVIGLASVILGVSLCRFIPKIKVTFAVIIGSILYRACVAAALQLGFQVNDTKLITAALLFIILVISMDRKKKVKAHA